MVPQRFVPTYARSPFSLLLRLSFTSNVAMSRHVHSVPRFASVGLRSASLLPLLPLAYLIFLCFLTVSLRKEALTQVLRLSAATTARKRRAAMSGTFAGTPAAAAIGEAGTLLQVYCNLCGDIYNSRLPEVA